METDIPLVLVKGSSKGEERFATVFLASSIAAIASVNFGFTLGYTSPTQHAIQSDKNLHLSDNQFSWFAVSSGLTFYILNFFIISMLYSQNVFESKLNVILTVILVY